MRQIAALLENERSLQTSLTLGLLGFDRADEAAIRRVLASRAPALARWRVGDLAEADAWWVHGAGVQLLVDGSLRVGPVHLAVTEVRRPIAFSRPVASSEFEPAYTFDVADPAGMADLLCTMEDHWVESKTARLWLAGRLSHLELETRVYHVLAGGRLLAVIDGAGAVGLAPGLTVAILLNAAWVRRPAAAAFIPASFQRTTVAELITEAR